MAERIPFKEAAETCHNIRATEKHLMCWGCIRASKGDPKLMCFHSQSDNRGCKYVNDAWESSKGGGKPRQPRQPR